MKTPKSTLICTVGTSLLGNLSRSEGEFKQYLKAENWQKLIGLLVEQNNSDRICGAEINSITSICNQQLIEYKHNLIFLVSDTDEGKKTGQLLQQYYEHSKNPIKFKD